jgi:seryl-tRNA(Sec) selenium transferase
MLSNFPDEMCECGHTRRSHVEGYENCIEEGCACIRYTWCSHVEEDEADETPEEERARVLEEQREEGL